jgi:hypothetical protein
MSKELDVMFHIISCFFLGSKPTALFYGVPILYLGFRQVSEGSEDFKAKTFGKQYLVFGTSSYT